MKKLTIALAALLLTACGNTTQTGKAPAEPDTLATEVAATDTIVAPPTVSIHKRWVEDRGDGTLSLFDLSDEQLFVEANTFDEDYCKEVGDDTKPGVFYTYGEPSKYRVVYATTPGDSTAGDVEYLIEEGPLKGQYSLRFSFSNLTATSAKFLFEGEFEHEYKATEEPIKTEPMPQQ